MKKLTLAAILMSMAMPLTAQADFDLDIGVVIDFRPGETHRRDRDGYIHHRNGRTYVNTQKVCNITKVQLAVYGDDMRIRDFDVMFGNGDTQDITVKDYFRRNSRTQWKDLKGDKRCIEGFFVDALPDRDLDEAHIVLMGKQRNGREVVIGHMKIREFNRRHRGNHRGWGGRDGWGDDRRDFGRRRHDDRGGYGRGGYDRDGHGRGGYGRGGYGGGRY